MIRDQRKEDQMSRLRAVSMLGVVLLLFCILAGCVEKNEIVSNDVDEDTTATIEEDPSSDGSVPIAPFEAAPSNSGKLHVSGAQLVASNGNPVQLRGVSTHGLAWFPQYVNQGLFIELRQGWGANVVRLAMYTAEYGGYCTGGDRSQLLDLIRNGVEFATQADLYVIVDWHILSDSNPLQNKDAAIEFFDTVSNEFANHDNVIYEICNEPNGSTTWSEIKEYANAVIPVIRSNDPNSLIIVGTPTWSQRVDEAVADPLNFENVMYALHFYAATHQQDLRDKLESAVLSGTPVFVTEFGICDASGSGAIDYASADAWIRLMDELDVSYICWNLSNKAETSAMFVPECSKVSGFNPEDMSNSGIWFWSKLDPSYADGDSLN